MAKKSSSREATIAVIQTDIRYIKQKLDELSEKFDSNTKDVVELKVRVDELERKLGEMQVRILEEQKREMVKWSTLVTAIASILATVLSTLVGKL